MQHGLDPQQELFCLKYFQAINRGGKPDYWNLEQALMGQNTYADTNKKRRLYVQHFQIFILLVRRNTSEDFLKN
jgi:hypothetical protein